MKEEEKPRKTRFFSVVVGKDAVIRVTLESGQDGVPNCPLKIDGLQLRTTQALATMLREGRLKEKAEFQILGENLYSLLFFNDVGKAVNNAFTEQLQFIRVGLEFEEGQEALSSLPWEYTYFPAVPGEGGGYFLAEQVKLVLTRHLRVKKYRNLRIDKPPLKLLFVASSPKGFDVEYEKVLDVIGARPELIKVTPLLPYDVDGITPKATWPNFNAMLENEEFHAIHFLGHGRWDLEAKTGTILFMKKDGTPDPRSDSDLATTLMSFESLRLVFLQACESAQSDPYQAFSGVALQLAQKGIPAVVGMQYKIKQQVANKFASTFYEALAEKLTVDVALQKARRTITEEFSDPLQRLGFGLPVLYLRESESLFAPAVPISVQEKTIVSEFVACPWCEVRNRITDKFCGDCRGSLICSNCKTHVDRKKKFCGECNTPLVAGKVAAPVGQPSAPSSEGDSFAVSTGSGNKQ